MSNIFSKRTRITRSINSRLRTAVAEVLEDRRLLSTTFTLDSDQSVIKLSAKALGKSLEEQSGGSLSAHYTGSIVADFDADSFQFLDGSDIEAVMRGSFAPGDQQANYAGEANQDLLVGSVHLGDALVKDLALSLSSDVIAVTANEFKASEIHANVTDGTLVYDINGFGDGDSDLADETDNNHSKKLATVTTDGTITTLTIPVSFTYEYGDVNAKLTLSGKIVAVSTGTAPFVDLNGPTEDSTNFDGSLVVGEATTVAAAADDTVVTDSDDTNLASMIITLTNKPDGTDEELDVTTTGGISKSYNPTTGVLTLTGSASTDNYATTLSTLTYANNAADPTIGARTITVVASDGTETGNTATSVITIANPNKVLLGDGQAKSVTFTDADGTKVTISKKGAGLATLSTSGATTQTVKSRIAKLEGAVSVESIDFATSGLTTQLSISAKGGDKLVTVGDVDSDGPLGKFGGAGVALDGDLSVNGELITASFASLTSSQISATQIGKITVAGTVNGSTISSSGNIAAVTAGIMSASQIYAGRSGSDLFPDDASDLPSESLIGKVTIGKKGSATPTFINSVVAANNLGTIALNLVQTDNGGTPFGVTADTITSISARNPQGQKAKLKNVETQADVQALIDAGTFAFGDLEIRVI